MYIRGADVSSLPEIEDHGGVFTSSGTQGDALLLLKANGINCIRLRLWNNPIDGYCSLPKVIQMARRIKQNNLSFLLDFHYSDTWADPSRQTKPQLWSTLTYQVLCDSIAAFTESVLSSLKSFNVLPDYIQFGNEITSGLLWNEGRVGGAYDTPVQWQQMTGLLKRAVTSADSIYNGIPYKKIIHIDRGGDTGGAQWFFDKLTAYNVPFDIIGLSYYPWWHGTLTRLTENLNSLVQRYNKEVLVAETAYPWTLAWADTTNNIVGSESQLLPGYPATVGGQKMFLQAVLSIVAHTQGNKGAGVCYWAPEAISAPGKGSSWENLALFNFSGEILGSAGAFNLVSSLNNYSRPETVNRISGCFPNPAGSYTSVILYSEYQAQSKMTLYDITGREINTVYKYAQFPEEQRITINTSKLPPGVYCIKIEFNGLIFRKTFLKQ